MVRTTKILCSFQLVLEKKTAEEKPWSSRLEFLENFFFNFALSEAQDNTNCHNILPTITSIGELYFRFRKFIMLVRTKKVISMNCGSCTCSCKPWVRLKLIFAITDIYISSNLKPLANAFKDGTWNIFQMVNNKKSQSAQ